MLISVAFAITANQAQTVTVSHTNLRNEKESEHWQVPLSVKLKQVVKNKTLLTAQRQHRMALVIGNSAYEEGSLYNPVNDATDISEASGQTHTKLNN